MGPKQELTETILTLKKEYTDLFGKAPKGGKCNDAAWLQSKIDEASASGEGVNKRDRDEDIETSVTYKRIKRAAANLQETLPIFLTLALMSMIMDIDNTAAASVWLGLRVAHLVCYAAGIAMLRSLSWVASIVALIYMALALL